MRNPPNTESTRRVRHSEAVQAAREDMHCVHHTHTKAGGAVAAQERRTAARQSNVPRVLEARGYHDYVGIALNLDERERLVADLAGHPALILRNHCLPAHRRRIPRRGLYAHVLPGEVLTSRSPLKPPVPCFCQTRNSPSTLPTNSPVSSMETTPTTGRTISPGPPCSECSTALPPTAPTKHAPGDPAAGPWSGDGTDTCQRLREY